MGSEGDSARGMANVNDFVQAGRQYWLVVMVMHQGDSRRLVCFRNGVRRTFTDAEVERVIKANLKPSKCKSKCDDQG